MSNDINPVKNRKSFEQSQDFHEGFSYDKKHEEGLKNAISLLSSSYGASASFELNTGIILPSKKYFVETPASKQPSEAAPPDSLIKKNLYKTASATKVLNHSLSETGKILGDVSLLMSVFRVPHASFLALFASDCILFSKLPQMLTNLPVLFSEFKSIVKQKKSPKEITMKSLDIISKMSTDFFFLTTILKRFAENSAVTHVFGTVLNYTNVVWAVSSTMLDTIKTIDILISLSKQQEISNTQKIELIHQCIKLAKSMGMLATSVAKLNPYFGLASSIGSSMISICLIAEEVSKNSILILNLKNMKGDSTKLLSEKIGVKEEDLDLQDEDVLMDAKIYLVMESIFSGIQTHVFDEAFKDLGKLHKQEMEIARKHKTQEDPHVPPSSVKDLRDETYKYMDFLKEAMEYSVIK